MISEVGSWTGRSALIDSQPLALPMRGQTPGPPVTHRSFGLHASRMIARNARIDAKDKACRADRARQYLKRPHWSSTDYSGNLAERESVNPH
jgi:hypothetical protein